MYPVFQNNFLISFHSIPSSGKVIALLNKHGDLMLFGKHALTMK